MNGEGIRQGVGGGAAEPMASTRQAAERPTGAMGRGRDASVALKVAGVTVAYGGLIALNNVSCAMPQGMTAIIGGNGAGKSTLVSVLSGGTRPNTGRVLLFGRELHGPDWRRSRRGLVRTFQHPQEFSAMTVLENVVVAACRGQGDGFTAALIGHRAWRAAEDKAVDRANDVLAMVGLDHMGSRLAGELSGGQRKLLELGRALAGSPSVILLDEPTAGVAPGLRKKMQDVLRSAIANGVSIAAVEHDLEFVEELSGHVVMLDAGQVVAEGGFEDVRRDSAFRSMLLGGHGGMVKSR